MNIQTASKEALKAEAHRQALIKAVCGELDYKHPTVEAKREYLGSRFTFSGLFADKVDEDQLLIDYRMLRAEEEAELNFSGWMIEAGREEEL
ncbi:hypothetical protein EauM23_00061 [Exiguobacterium phage vB_EauM-23]|nr:hypothetical protein EauM23_00061 [Exiguobacterium phage vB_EauM-23]